MKHLARLFAFLCGLYASAALAAYQPSAVVNVPTYAAVSGGNFSNTTELRIAEAVTGLGGGGEFSKTTCTPDGGTCIADAAGNHFKRIIDANKPINMTWWGVADATTPACQATISTCDVYPIWASIQAAATSYGNNVISTGGRSVAFVTGAPTLNQNIAFTCDGAAGGSYKQSVGAGSKIYNLPNSVVLNPAYTFTVPDNSEFSRCIVRPTWYVPGTYSGYTIPAATVQDLNGIYKQFAGTAVLCGGEACNVHDLSIVAFDVGVQVTGPRSKVCDILSENNIEVWVSTQRGGMELCRIDNPPTYVSNRYTFTSVDYPVTAAVNSGGAIQLTLDPSGVTGGMQINVGDGVFVGGMQYAYLGALVGSAIGDVSSTVNPNIILNVNVSGASTRTPFPGMSVTDNSGCIPANTVITAWMPDNDDDPNVGTMTINANATCTMLNDRLSLTDTSTGTPGAIGAQIVSAVSGNNITLKGLLWSGPTKTSSSWNAGYTVITTKDSTDIAPFGQYLCNSGTAPFGCTLPTGWAQSTVSATNINGLGTGTGNVTFTGSTTGWPSAGVFKVDSEVIGYSIANSTTLTITARGLQCTTAVAHANPSTLTPAAPLVTFIAAQDNKIVMNVAAQSTSTGTTKFANDPTICGAIIGDVALIPQYKTYSASAGAGQNMGTQLNSVASGSASSQTLTLGGDAYWYRAFEGETVTDITTPGSIAAGTVVDQTPTSGAIHLSQAIVSNISGDLIAFGADGSCGYPGLISGGTKQPWLGNCASGLAILGMVGGNSVQGVRCYSNHNSNHRNGLRLFNAPATSCTMNVLNSSGKADGYDFNKTAIWASGIRTQKELLTNNRTSVVLIDNTVNNNGDIGIDNTQIGGSFVVGSGLVHLSEIHPSGTVQNYPTVLVEGANGTGTSIASTQLPGYQFITDGTAADALVHCSSDTVIPGSACAFSSQTFTPTGATTATTLPNFADRSLSILDFNTVSTPAIPDCATPVTAAVTAAGIAALAQGVHVIRMDTNATGNCYAIGTYTVPAGITLYCPGPPPEPILGNDYRNAPQRIALTTTAGLSLVGQISNCLIIQKALAIATPPATFQDNYARSLSFTGTGVTVTGENADLRDTMILGFSVGMQTKASRGATFQNLYIDATDCYRFWNQGGGGALMGNNLQCSPYATRFGVLAEPSFVLSSITDNGSGVLQAHLTSSCTGTGCPLNGYKVWIGGGANASVQSAQGGWTAANVTSTTIDLQGSVSTFITGQTESATTTTGSVVVSGITTNIAQVQKTQSVTGTCIPVGATIAAVERDYGIIWLDSAHAATATGACTVTITDTAPASVSVSTVAIGSNAGTSYAAGDIVSLVGGTGTAAQINIDAVDPTTGAVTAVSINDGGLYTVSPGSTDVATSGGTGSGLLVNISTGATLYGSAVNRTGPAFSFFKITDVRLTNIGDLSHAVGMTFGNGAHSVSVSNCSLHDENVLQDQTHHGIEFLSTSNNNKVDHCDSYYFGSAVYSHNLSGFSLSANVVTNSALGGSAGNSGLQNTILDMGSATPATQSKSSLTMSGNLSTVFGTLMVMGDERSLNIGLNSFPNALVYGQNAAAQTLTTGCGNSFGATSPMPIYCVQGSSNIVPGSLNESGGQIVLANVAGTFTPYVNGSTVFDTGALTNNRNLTLSNTGATGGFSVTVIRTGSSGGFVRNVYQADGTTLITAIADGTSASFKFNSATSLWVKQ